MNKGRTHVLCAITKSRMLELLQGIQAGTILKKYEFLHELAKQGVPIPPADQREMQEIALIKIIKENPEVWKYAYTSNEWDAVMVVRGHGGMLGVEFVQKKKEVPDGDQPVAPKVD